MVYSFETQWPAPFERGWKRSRFSWPTIEDAAKALADWLAICFHNDVQMEGRIVKVE